MFLLLSQFALVGSVFFSLLGAYFGRLCVEQLPTMERRPPGPSKEATLAPPTNSPAYSCSCSQALAKTFSFPSMFALLSAYQIGKKRFPDKSQMMRVIALFSTMRSDPLKKTQFADASESLYRFSEFQMEILDGFQLFNF